MVMNHGKISSDNTNEFYSVAFRKKIYNSIEELQEDADKWIDEYNSERTHTGKYCFGKTPLQTFFESKHLAQEKMLDKLQLTDTTTVRSLMFVRSSIV